jgi:hypothetical protein
MALVINKSAQEVRLSITDDDGVVINVVCAAKGTCDVPACYVSHAPGGKSVVERLSGGALVPAPAGEVATPVVAEDAKLAAKKAK